jgi:hypothetical protein
MINYTNETFFDTTSNEVTKTLDGITGFYISKYCLGEYSMKIKLLTTNNNVKYLNFSNTYSFDKNSDIAFSIEANEANFIIDNSYNEETL